MTRVSILEPEKKNLQNAFSLFSLMYQKGAEVKTALLK